MRTCCTSSCCAGDQRAHNLNQPHLPVGEHNSCLLVGCQLADDLSVDTLGLCEVVDLESGLLAIDSAVVGDAKLGGLALEVV